MHHRQHQPGAVVRRRKQCGDSSRRPWSSPASRSFQFVCHGIGHANRKAANERSFWSVETNFLRGRTFASLEDLNVARQWATVRMEHRVQTKARIIPAQLFEHERLYLQALPPHLPAPYQMHQRVTDQYGYVAFAANYYWVPGTRRDDVKVLQYADRVKIYRHYDCLAEYPLPPEGTRCQHYSPPGQPQPRYQPRNRHRHAKLEEQRLRALGSDVSAYLDFALAAPGRQRHRFTRELFALSRKLTDEVFRHTVRRAYRYRILDLATLRRIAWLCLSQEDDALPEVEVDDDFRQRPAYQEGYLTDPPDLSQYDQLRKRKNRRTPMTNPADVSSQTVDEERKGMLKYLRLGRLLAHWDETLEQARKGRFSSERLLKYVVEQEYRTKRENCAAAAATTSQHPRDAGDGNVPLRQTTETRSSARHVAL